MEEKFEMPRNILVSPDLELEMSGINERGIKPPPIRIPGKTHLADVLLTSNPWEQRDLERKLKELNRLQVQKERAHVWSQRRFFMNRIFDSDLSLRFGKLDVERELREKSGRKSAAGGKKGRTCKVGKEKESLGALRPGTSKDKEVELKNKTYENPTGSKSKSTDDKRDTIEDSNVASNGDMNKEADGPFPKPPLLRAKTIDSTGSIDKAPTAKPLPRLKSMNSLGIFATPLPENKRKYKIRSTTANVMSKRATQNNGDKGTLKPVVSPMPSNEENKAKSDEALVEPPPVLEKSQTAPFILLRRATTGIDLHKDKGSVKDMTPDDLSRSPGSSKKLLKHDGSFKQDPAVVITGAASPTETHSDKGDKKAPSMNGQDGDDGKTVSVTQNLDNSESKKQEDSGAICEESVIVSLTRTLPTALMLKANANINAVINDRKHTMITESREISTRNTFSDERWRNLESLLVPQDRQPLESLNKGKLTNSNGKE